MRFCAFRVPDMRNPEDIIKCLDSHLEDLNPPCQDMVKNATATLKKFHTACDPDFNNICPEAVGKLDKTHDCVIENLAALSSGCLQTISDIAKDMKKHRPGPPPHGPGGMQFDDFTRLGSTTLDGEMQMQSFGSEDYGNFEYDEYERHQGKRVFFHAMFAGCIGALFTIGIVVLVKKFLLKRKMREQSNKVPMGAPLMTDAEIAASMA